MKILLLGSGGREHALAWKIAQSPKVEKLYIAPGNAGTTAVGENVNIKATDFEAISAFALKENIEMVVVGPEDPLVEGIYDYFQNRPELKHIAVIGPSANGAQLEGSKEFAKGFMMRHRIPTARYKSITTESPLRTEGRRPLCRKRRSHSPYAGRSQERTEGNAWRHVRLRIGNSRY